MLAQSPRQGGSSGEGYDEPVLRLMKRSWQQFHYHTPRCIPYHLAWVQVATELHKHALATEGRDEQFLAYAQGALRTVGFLLADDRSAKGEGEQQLFLACDSCAAAVFVVIESAARLLLSHGIAVHGGLAEADLALRRAGGFGGRANMYVGTDIYELCALRLAHRVAGRSEKVALAFGL